MGKNLGILVVIVLVISGVWYAVQPKQNDAQKGENAAAQTVTVKGSDTEEQLVSNLAETFSEQTPDAVISVTGGGSGVGIAAIINGETDLANSSRPMKEEERTQAQGVGRDVKEFIIARDGLSLIVHPSNSIASLTLDQIKKIYRREIKNWKEVGGSDADIVLYGRQSTSGTYVFFRDAVVQDDYAPEMRNMEGNEAIVDAVKADVNGIGYVGLGYVKQEDGSARKDIRIISLAKMKGVETLSPLDTDSVKSGRYPLTRPLYQYMQQLPARNSALEQFLRFENSPEAAVIIEKAGFISRTPEQQKQNENFLEAISPQ